MAATWLSALRLSNLGFLAFRVMVATLLAGGKSSREDVDRRSVHPMSSSVAPRSLGVHWPGQNCGWMRRGTRED